MNFPCSDNVQWERAVPEQLLLPDPTISESCHMISLPPSPTSMGACGLLCFQVRAKYDPRPSIILGYIMTTSLACGSLMQRYSLPPAYFYILRTGTWKWLLKWAFLCNVPMIKQVIFYTVSNIKMAIPLTGTFHACCRKGRLICCMACIIKAVLRKSISPIRIASGLMVS